MLFILCALNSSVVPQKSPAYIHLQLVIFWIQPGAELEFFRVIEPDKSFTQASNYQSFFVAHCGSGLNLKKLFNGI